MHTLSPTLKSFTSGPISTTTPADPSPSTCGCVTSRPPSFWWRSRGVEAVQRTLTRTSSPVGLGVGTFYFMSVFAVTHTREWK